MDNRFKQGLLFYERRFHRNSSVRGGCPEQHAVSRREIAVEVSSTYLDYPKAPSRLASVMPYARIVLVLREPTSRALSAFNFRWMTWLCGKLVWTRADCWAAVTSEEAVRKAQVGPFQMRSALKLWRSCASGGAGPPRLSCLQQDYKERFRDKIESELKALQRCRANAQEATTPASIDWLSCLGPYLIEYLSYYIRC